MSGWSMRGKNKYPSSSNEAQFLKLATKFLVEAQVTLRSALFGVQRLNVKTPIVREILLQLASEVLSWKTVVDQTQLFFNDKQKSVFESRTVKLLNEIYGENEALKKEPTVIAMLALL
jgi:hypothetical protein